MTQNITGDQNQYTWPELPAPGEWQKSLEAVHLWSQIIGKIRLEHMPPINHCWHVALYVSARGLSTSLIPHPSGGFEIEFNFVDHKLDLQKVNGKRISFDLKPMSVADFYHKTLDGLKQLNIDTKIYSRPVELPVLLFLSRKIPGKHLMMRIPYKTFGWFLLMFTESLQNSNPDF